MHKIIKSLAAVALAVAAGGASAASLSLDVPISVNVTPTCRWTSSTADSLSTADLSQPATTSVQLQATCDAGVAYTIRSDVDAQSSTVGGSEPASIALYADAGYTSPLATGPGISGTVADTGAYIGESVTATVYVKATGSGAGGGFNSAGVIAQRSFNLTISY